MSLTPVHTLFQSPYFSPNVPFLFLNPRQKSSRHLVIMSPSPPFSGDSFSDCPCFWWPWQFWGVLAKCNTGWPELAFVSGLDRSEVKCRFHHVRWRVPANIRTTAADVDLDNLADVELFHCKTTLFETNFCHGSFEYPWAIPFKTNHTPNYHPRSLQTRWEWCCYLIKTIDRNLNQGRYFCPLWEHCHHIPLDQDPAQSNQ